VQLTKDHVPVVYHDFIVSETGTDLPLHNLSLEQVSRDPSEKHSPGIDDLRFIVYAHQRSAVAATPR